MNQKPPYKLVTQQPYCCVPACLSMILDRRKIKHKSQEEIGYELGLVVPEDKAHFFTKVRTCKKSTTGYGTPARKKKYSVNNYFSKNKIKLKETYYQQDKIKDVKKFIIQNLQKGNDLIVCFNYRALYRPKDKESGGLGHISLIQSIHDDIITLIDSVENVPNKRKVKLEKLTSAMKYHGTKNKGGFWLIQTKK